MPCQPLKVLVAPRLLFSGTLKGTWLVLGPRVPSGALSSKKDLVSFPLENAACVCWRRSSEWNARCTVCGRGAAARPEDHAGWATPVLHHCALESPREDLPGQRGKQVPGRTQASGSVGGAARLGPSSGPSSPSSSSSSTSASSQSSSVVTPRPSSVVTDGLAVACLHHPAWRTVTQIDKKRA